MFTPETGEIPDALVNGATPTPKPKPKPEPTPEKKPKSPKKPARHSPEKTKARKQAAHKPKPTPEAASPLPAATSPTPETASATTPTSTPAPTPAAAPPLDAATVAQRPELWPGEVTLTQATRLPIFFDGKMAGEAEAPAGLRLPLSSVTREGDRVVVLYFKSKIPLHVSSTNLLELARQRDEQLRAAPAQTPLPTPPEESEGTPLPESGAAEPESPGLPEIPGLSPEDETPALPETLPEPPAPSPAPSPDADDAPVWILRRPTEPLPEADASPTPRPGW